MASNRDNPDPRDIEAGDVLTVEYVSSQGDAERSETAEVLAVERTDAHEGHFVWMDFYLARHHDEEDTIPRRRVSYSPGDTWTYEARRTTLHGARWQRINAVTDAPDVVVEDDR